MRCPSSPKQRTLLGLGMAGRKCVSAAVQGRGECDPEYAPRAAGHAPPDSVLIAPCAQCRLALSGKLSSGAHRHALALVERDEDLGSRAHACALPLLRLSELARSASAFWA